MAEISLKSANLALKWPKFHDFQRYSVIFFRKIKYSVIFLSGILIFRDFFRGKISLQIEIFAFNPIIPPIRCTQPYNAQKAFYALDACNACNALHTWALRPMQ